MTAAFLLIDQFFLRAEEDIPDSSDWKIPFIDIVPEEESLCGFFDRDGIEKGSLRVDEGIDHHIDDILPVDKRHILLHIGIFLRHTKAKLHLCK